jgi:hypothetical protein
MKTWIEIALIFTLFCYGNLILAQGDGVSATHSVSVDWKALLLVDLESESGDTDMSMSTDYTYGSLNIDAGQGMGEGTVLDSDESTWVNWTVFAPEDNSQKFKIDVKTDYDFDNGWGLRVTPLINGTVSSGTATAQSPFMLSNIDQAIVTDISYLGWSGNGINQGCNVKYEVVVTEPQTIISSDQSVAVMYTISSQ